jgi:conjugal transfer pilin signal peptidase TrbI
MHMPMALSNAKRVACSRFGFLLDVSFKDLAVGTLVFFGVLTAVTTFNEKFGVFLDTSEMRCMPEVLFVGYPRGQALGRGDVVSYRATSRDMLDLFTGQRLAKIVRAVPGDYVLSNKDGVFVNGVFQGARNPVSLQKIEDKGKRVIDVDRMIEPGEVFVMGTLERSFDSRYWGVLPESSVDRLLLAVY